VRDPGRTLPRALLFGMLAVTAVYIVVNAVFLYLVPLEKVTSDQTFVAQAGEVLFGPTGGVIFAATVAVCLIGSLAALIISAPRVYYAMASDGLFFPAVAKTHPRFGTRRTQSPFRAPSLPCWCSWAVLNRSFPMRCSLQFSFWD
jgi:APA family basic amino acid/polyamine antiporter